MNKDTIREHTFLSNQFSEESVILDLGSHKGEFSIEFASKYLYKKIIAVEANPELFEETLAASSNVKNLYAINAVVSNTSSTSGSFYVNPKLPETSSEIQSMADELWWYTEETSDIDLNPTQKINVQYLTLENIISEFNLDRIDLIKMDIEGSEWEILSNLSKAQSDIIIQISVEFHDFYGKKYREKSIKAIDHLKKLGYTFEHKPGYWGFGTPYADCIFYKKEATI